MFYKECSEWKQFFCKLSYFYYTIGLQWSNERFWEESDSNTATRKNKCTKENLHKMVQFLSVQGKQSNLHHFFESNVLK